jgi:hypothetical protein
VSKKIKGKVKNRLYAQICQTGAPGAGAGLVWRLSGKGMIQGDCHEIKADKRAGRKNLRNCF